MADAQWLTVDPKLDLQAPVLCDMLRLWRDKAGDRAMPSRRDFTPQDLRSHLGWIVLLDVEPSPLRFRYRLVGTEVTQRVGRDATGQYLDELYAPEIYRTATSAFKVLLADRRPVRAHGELRHAEKGHIRFEALDMPLSDDGEAVSMIMTRGCF